jgi:hypothetical protein
MPSLMPVAEEMEPMNTRQSHSTLYDALNTATS